MKLRSLIAGMAGIVLAAGCSSGSSTTVPSELQSGNAPAASSSARAAPRYSIVELPSLGGSVSIGGAINQQGDVAGASSLPGDANQHATLWRRNTVTDLGSLGGPNSFAQWLNDQDSVSVISDTATQDPFGEDYCLFGTHLICRGFVWRDGSKTQLPTIGGNNDAPLFGYNNRGQVAGIAETDVHDATCAPPEVLRSEAVLWGRDPAQITVLPPLPGDTNGQAGAVNEKGDAAGGTGDCASVQVFGGAHAVLWRHGVPTDLGNLGGPLDNAAFGINNRDQVTGHSDLPGDTLFHGFLWQNGIMTDLGTLPGDTISTAPAINNTGLIAGFSCRGPGERGCQAVIWKDGSIFNLNDLIPASSSLYLIVAFAVNNAGDVTGIAVDTTTGNVVAYLASPTGKNALVTHTVRRVTQLSPLVSAQLQRLLRVMRRGLMP